MEDIRKEVGEIIDRLAVIFDEEDVDSPDIQSEIERLGERLEELTGKTIDECRYFEQYWSYTSLDDIVDRVLMPEKHVRPMCFKRLGDPSPVAQVLPVTESHSVNHQ